MAVKAPFVNVSLEKQGSLQAKSLDSELRVYSGITLTFYFRVGLIH